EAVPPLDQMIEANRVAARHGRERVWIDTDRHVQLFRQKDIKAAQQRPAAGENNTVVDQIGNQFRIALLDHLLETIEDRLNRAAKRFANLLAGDNRFSWNAADRVPPANLCVQLLIERGDTADRDLELLGSRNADSERVMLSQVLDNGF